MIKHQYFLSHFTRATMAIDGVKYDSSYLFRRNDMMKLQLIFHISQVHHGSNMSCSLRIIFDKYWNHLFALIMRVEIFEGWTKAKIFFHSLYITFIIFYLFYLLFMINWFKPIIVDQKLKQLTPLQQPIRQIFAPNDKVCVHMLSSGRRRENSFASCQKTVIFRWEKTLDIGESHLPK